MALREEKIIWPLDPKESYYCDHQYCRKTDLITVSVDISEAQVDFGRKKGPICFLYDMGVPGQQQGQHLGTC